MRAKTFCSLVSLVLATVLAGCGRDEVKVDFMTGCVQGGAVPKSICTCVFDKMEKELRAMYASQSVSDETAQHLVMASAACARR